MKNYTAKEILKIRENMHEEIKKEYEENRKAWDRKDKYYNYNHSFFTNHCIISDHMEYNNIYDCVESLKNTIAEIEEFEENNFFIEHMKYDDFVTKIYDDYLDEVYYERKYLVIKKDNVDDLLQKRAGSSFRKHLSDLMFDKKTHGWKPSIDYKLFKLFAEGNIDWKTFVKINCASCEI